MSDKYVIYSLKWTRGDNIIWWGPDNCGYTVRLEDAGKYTLEQIQQKPDYYNDGVNTLAIPLEVAQELTVQVVPNTISNIDKLKQSAVQRMALV